MFGTIIIENSNNVFMDRVATGSEKEIEELSKKIFALYEANISEINRESFFRVVKPTNFSVETETKRTAERVQAVNS